MKLGFIGTGEITVAMVTGFCTAQPRPDKVWVSPRNAEKASALAAAFPEVAVAASNQDVVEQSDWLIVAVLPQIVRDVLATLSFGATQRVISVVPGLPLAELADLVVPAEALAQVLPMPPAARHLGPIAVCPPQAEASALFGQIGTIVEVEDPRQFEAFWSATALMAPYYGLLGRASDWLARQGVPDEAGGRYVGSMFHALAENARDADAEGFRTLIASSQTPGGLNEQCYRQLGAAGWYDDVDKALDGILARLAGS